MFHVAIGGSLIAAAGGWFCLIGYALTAGERLALCGILWLPVGGILTLTSLICGLIYQSQARAVSFSPPHTARRGAWAVRLPASNILLAIFCVIVGVALVEHYRAFD